MGATTTPPSTAESTTTATASPPPTAMASTTTATAVSTTPPPTSTPTASARPRLSPGGRTMVATMAAATAMAAGAATGATGDGIKRRTDAWTNGFRQRHKRPKTITMKNLFQKKPASHKTDGRRTKKKDI